MPVCGYRAGFVVPGLAQLWPKSGSESKISGRFLKSSRGPFSSADCICPSIHPIAGSVRRLFGLLTLGFEQRSAKKPAPEVRPRHRSNTPMQSNKFVSDFCRGGEAEEGGGRPEIADFGPFPGRTRTRGSLGKDPLDLSRSEPGRPILKKCHEVF